VNDAVYFLIMDFRRLELVISGVDCPRLPYPKPIAYLVAGIDAVSGSVGRPGHLRIRPGISGGGRAGINKNVVEIQFFPGPFGPWTSVRKATTLL
jgi:hypothetical protein